MNHSHDMKFHAAVAEKAPLRLPLMFGHFVPWFTLKGNDFSLPKDAMSDLNFKPKIEDYRHWNDSRSVYRRTHLHMPAIGIYDSRNPDVIEWQIQTALRFGVSGFIINWYGKHSVENILTLHFLRGLKRWNDAHPDQPFLYFFSIDSQCLWPSEGKQPVRLEEDFAYIRQHLIHDAYLHRDGHPVFSVFPYENNVATWRKALNSVWDENGADLIWMNSAPGGGENAFYPWIQPDKDAVDLSSSYTWQNPDNVGDAWLTQLYHSASSLKQPPEYMMAGVWPGFDDQLVSWAWNADPENPKIRPRVMCRETTRGNTLELTWQVYLAYLAAWARHDATARVPVPLIQLVTWNDYAEASTVEPTRDYGEAPLSICKTKLDEAQRIWSQRK